MSNFPASSIANVEAETPGMVPFPDIPFRRFRLANGLTLIVHEDRTAPLIAAELRFNVGSKDEPPGRYGFAHLFEHLMFKESANRRGNWHSSIATLGGSNVNGMTSYDRTTYFQTVPTGAIDTLLWMESDRMGHLLEGLSADVLAAEIAVVKNEKRQREGAPLGRVAEAIAEVLYPFGHPYGHTIIGTFQDLDQATMTTARDWYRRWYGAANAILVLAGDIAPDEALAKVEHWFGDLPTGEPIRRALRWVPPRQGAQRLSIQDRVSNPGVVKVWIVPAYGDADTVDLGFLATALTGTRGAVLVRRLVEDERLCTAVEASVERRNLCSEFCISATFVHGADGRRVEEIIDEELQRLLAVGPDAQDISHALRMSRMEFIDAQAAIAIKAELLAASEMVFGAPDGYRQMDAIAATATPDRVAAAGRRWLAEESLTLDIHPYVERRDVVTAPDRITRPQPLPIIPPLFPHVERALLSNGIKVELAHRPGSAKVSVLLLIDSGSSGDLPGSEGLTAFTLAQMLSGTHSRDRHAIDQYQTMLGARITAIAGLDHSSIRCNVLRDRYADAIRLMAEVALRPAFPDVDFIRSQTAALAALENEWVTDEAAAERARAVLTFGATHVLARRPGGSVASIASLSRDALQGHHATLFRPVLATLFVVGDLTLDQATAPLEAGFGEWRAPGELVPLVDGVLASTPGRYLVARNGTAQSVIKGSLARSEFGRANMIGPSLGLFSYIFGGSFESRLNTNLRERRGWTYGAHSDFARWQNLGSFNVTTSVQSDRTIDALDQIAAEIADIASRRPITDQELEHARNALLLEMPNYWISDDNILAALVDRHTHRLPDDHHDRLGERVCAVSLCEVRDVADLVKDATAMTFVIAGDPARFSSAGLHRITEDGALIK